MDGWWHPGWIGGPAGDPLCEAWGRERREVIVSTCSGRAPDQACCSVGSPREGPALRQGRPGMQFPRLLPILQDPPALVNMVSCWSAVVRPLTLPPVACADQGPGPHPPGPLPWSLALFPVPLTTAWHPCCHCAAPGPALMSSSPALPVGTRGCGFGRGPRGRGGTPTCSPTLAQAGRVGEQQAQWVVQGPARPARSGSG